ncbi:T9SS type A sorting domain-containing protein [Soonwooa sp.]|uniref:T9SS type A sorting domain-containing protein n=1 Tax=Soonwooa sp. TaxID=1938592 RepID=UPI00260CC29F|nr:T9SS type A sorting domain-containing protein [Soonwooa sp.]
MKKRFLLPLSCAALLTTNIVNAQLVFSTVTTPGYSRPGSVNNSGTVVTAINSQKQYLWLKGSEMVQFGQLTGQDQAMSPKTGEDNTKIYGQTKNFDTNKLGFGVFDTNSQAWTILGDLLLFDVSSDGTTAVGAGGENGYTRSFKWVKDTGFINLGSTYPNRDSRADAISNDKKVVGGYQDQLNSLRTATYWMDGNEINIKTATGDFVEGIVHAINYDGTIMAGNPNVNKLPFIYDRLNNKVTYIESQQYTTNPTYKGYVNGINDAGTIIIGYYSSFLLPTSEGYIWTKNGGYQDFTEYVKKLGIDVQGLYLYPTAMSPDGLKYAGYAQSGAEQKTWMLDLTTYLATNNTSKAEVKVYPNPASNILNISGLKADTKISIHNVAGQLVKTSTSSQIDINNLPKGNYIISYDVNGKATSQKFIKQ